MEAGIQPICAAAGIAPPENRDPHEHDNLASCNSIRLVFSHTSNLAAHGDAVNIRKLGSFQIRPGPGSEEVVIRIRWLLGDLEMVITWC